MSDLFQRIANDASVTLGGQVCDYLDQAVQRGDSSPLDSVVTAVVCGAMTGALRALKACDEVGMVADVDRTVENLLRELANCWGQIQGDLPTGGTVQ